MLSISFTKAPNIRSGEGHVWNNVTKKKERKKEKENRDRFAVGNQRSLFFSFLPKWLTGPSFTFFHFGKELCITREKKKKQK